MRSTGKTKLAASFVLTAAALPAVAGLAGCRKQTVDEGDARTKTGDRGALKRQPAYVNRQGDRCTMSVNIACPPDVSCNPPAPIEIDCPPEPDAGPAADAGRAPARPAGKEDWLRVRPHLWASRHGCGYSPEYFCAPPPKPHECTAPATPPDIRCSPANGADAGTATSWTIASFVAKDGLGTCRKIPSFDCTSSDCIDAMPAGEIVPCP